MVTACEGAEQHVGLPPDFGNGRFDFGASSWIIRHLDINNAEHRVMTIRAAISMRILLTFILVRSIDACVL
jgi:hypothetical protein